MLLMHFPCYWMVWFLTEGKFYYNCFVACEEMAMI